ncbi:DapH/DapD/GlmU-related protein [Pseudomonas chlororaphis subsp. aurantiaca]|uniref:DapH/DapD/GlmU-related protein n=1 Tax=Pseudomonas chlororaphis TaxID=587753 RepID=UPI0027DE6DA9|nr:DapH/DapD/GlmU-related protein [Pseudomonas chlororaphis]WMI97601.1 DapH/DapD/GlmU-related protein [Pseudomonas chlororaphis subsp. aurantiaca]
MKYTVILGADAALECAWQVAELLYPDAVRLSLASTDRFNFDLSPLLQHYAPAETRVFVALDGRAVNYARHGLIAQVQLAGYRLISLVSPQAMVDASVRVGANVYIGPGANIGPECVLGMGSWLDRRVVLDREVKLGACVTLDSAVVLGNQVSIGKGSTLGLATVALPGTVVGKRCEWLLGTALPRQLPDNSLYDELMPQGARVFRY